MKRLIATLSLGISPKSIYDAAQLVVRQLGRNVPHSCDQLYLDEYIRILVSGHTVYISLCDDTCVYSATHVGFEALDTIDVQIFRRGRWFSYFAELWLKALQLERKYNRERYAVAAKNFAAYDDSHIFSKETHGS